MARMRPNPGDVMIPNIDDVKEDRFIAWLERFESLRVASEAFKYRGINVSHEQIRAWINGKALPRDATRIAILQKFPESGLTLLDFYERVTKTTK